MYSHVAMVIIEVSSVYIKSVKRFERSNGLDSALYKKSTFTIYHGGIDHMKLWCCIWCEISL